MTPPPYLSQAKKKEEEAKKESDARRAKDVGRWKRNEDKVADVLKRLEQLRESAQTQAGVVSKLEEFKAKAV